MGCQVRILAASFSHLRQKNPSLDARSESIDGIEYRWLPTPVYAGNGLGRVHNIAAFATRLFGRAGVRDRDYRPNLVISSSTHPFDIYAARSMAHSSGSLLVFEVHDLWPLTPMELGGMSRFHPFMLACARAESFAYTHADHVVSMLPAAEPYMRSRGLRPGRFTYIPNGMDVTWWQDQALTVPSEHAEVLDDLRSRGCFVVGYIGSHGIANALDMLLDAAELLRDHSIAFVLIGSGPERSSLQRDARARSLDNVWFLPAVPKPAVPGLLSVVDCAYLGWRRSSLYRFGISPNKILDYMMAGCPIVHAVDAANDPVAAAGCGFSVAPDDPAAIAGAVSRMASLDPDARRTMGDAGRHFVMQNHDYRVLARRFLEGALSNERR
jgi:glycosyltransferase involved in cell wall biosynthesis